MARWSKKISAWVSSHPEQVEHYDCGGPYESHIVYLAEGWCNRFGDHFISELYAWEVLRELRKIEPCSCTECSSESKVRADQYLEKVQ